ncbi:MAG: 50S ribosomal protein L16 [Candidatus Pacearchaeota archaeon]
MGVRKASCYSKMKVVPYTRKSKQKSKSYIKTIPNTNIVKLRMGDLDGFLQKKYKKIFELKSNEEVQIRDIALESARQYLNRSLADHFGKEFYLELKVYPHHIIRENRMLTGAGADRMSTGMSLSFGTTIGRSALVKKDKTIYLIAINGDQSDEKFVRDLFESIKSRLPCKVRVVQTNIE